MAHRSIANARFLITGASSGIGAALARALARRGARLMLNGRRVARLEELRDSLRDASPEILLAPGDITDAAARDRLAEAIRRHWDGLDVLVNNAGIGAQGSWREADPERLRRVMEVNFFAPLQLTRRLLPELDRGQWKTVAFVGSVLSHFSMGGKSEYCASKFALRGMVDALRRELGQLRWVMISPSTTRTEFFERALDAETSSQSPYRFGAMAPEAVAEKAVRAIVRGRRELFLTWGARLLAWLDRWAPGVADRVLAPPPESASP